MKNLVMLAVATFLSATAFAQVKVVDEIKPEIVTPEVRARANTDLFKARGTISGGPKDVAVFDEARAALGDIPMSRIGSDFVANLNALSKGEAADMSALKASIAGVKTAMVDVNKMTDAGKRGQAQTALGQLLIAHMRALQATTGGIENENQLADVAKEAADMIKAGRVDQAIKMVLAETKEEKIIYARAGRHSESHTEAARAAAYQKAVNQLAANTLGITEEDLKPGTIVPLLNPLARVNANGDVVILDGSKERAFDMRSDLVGDEATKRRYKSEFDKAWDEIMRCLGAKAA